MTAGTEEAAPPASPGNEPVPATVRLRWVSVAEAAGMLGISEVAVRKRLACRSLPGLRVGRGWRVLLAGDPKPPAAVAAPSTPPAGTAPDGDTIRVLARTSEALEAVIRDLQRQSLALSAQVGYLQSQLAEAQKQVKLLTERNASAVEPGEGGPSRAEYQAAQATIAALCSALEEAQKATPADAPPPSRGWRFWRRG